MIKVPPKSKSLNSPIDLSSNIADDEYRIMYSPGTVIYEFIKKFPNVEKIYPVEYFLPRSEENTRSFEKILEYSGRFRHMVALLDED